ncbi:hypothetical protein SLS56_009247 [Neofusicoccum ribis]|uniref:C2H2-type domain-containing protein n=1 Tax=Neofusicoccum ribis TaxID=45134 RepID=A0ABR3SHW5_9PEZI
MPPTPHSARENLSEDWMVVPPQQNGLPFEHSTSQDAHGHELDDYSTETWQLGFSAKPRLVEPEVQSRPNSWVMVANNALRVPGSESDILPGARDFTASFESQMAPQATRSLQPAAEIYSSSEIWSASHTTTSGFNMPGVAAEVYAPVGTGFNPEYGWPVGTNQAFDLPMYPDHSPDLVQPEDTMMDAEDKYNEMRSDSFDDSFGSYDGYSASTSPSSRYGHAEETHIKQEGDSDFHRRDSKHNLRDYMTPVRKNSRRESKVRAGGINKRKVRSNNLMESFDAHHNGCQVEVKYQAGIQVDPKSGRYCSASGETKKQRCRFDGCVKTFARPEHLKRHENTHSKERPFPCVVPQCGRRFSRNDNRKAHYETHLKEALLGKKARNAPVSFDELCQYLHQSEPEEEARKMIEKLQNPKSKMKSRD